MAFGTANLLCAIQGYPMTGRQVSFFSHRVLLTLLVLIVALVLGIFFLVQRSVKTFKSEEITKNMTWMSNSVSYFCSSGYDQLARVGKVTDKIEVLLKQAETIEMIEDFVRNNDFSIIIYNVSSKKPLSVLSSLLNAENHIAPLSLEPQKIESLQIDKRQYTSLAVRFNSWNWLIVLLKDSSSYDTFLSRLNVFYFAISLLIGMLVFVFFLFFKQQKRSEIALRENEMALKSTLDSLAEGVITIGADGNISQINPAALTIAGYDSFEEIHHRNASEVIPLLNPLDNMPLSILTFINRVTESQSEGETSELFLVSKSGEKKLIQIRLAQSTSPNLSKKHETFVLSLHDITQHKAVEKQLFQAQKMEAIGLMAGGVAHDLNNILSGIVSYPELLLQQLPDKSELRKPIQTIIQSGKRAAAVVADLLTVARGVASTREVSNLNAMLKEYTDSPEFIKLQDQYPKISYSIHAAKDLANISCSKVHVKKCFMNLFLNSAEALSGEGSCIVSTRNETINNIQADKLRINPGDYAILSIQDNGPGINKDHIGHIFEPFYTKKKMGASGTGLGLAIVWNTMQDHNGIITVVSDKKNTIFTLYFPISSKKEAALKKHLSLDQFQGNNETILIIDDDPQQREIATQILKTFNYSVEVASSGEEAIGYLKEEEVDLILLDMIMDQGLNGYETFKEIINTHPGQKAVIASGFSESEDVKNTLKLGAGGYIKKPYSMEELGKTVQDVLQQ